MSKVDAQRAMREAKYAAYQASLAAAGGPPAPGPTDAKPAQAARKVASRPKVTPAAADEAATEAATTEPSTAAPDEPALCGHRNIGNKSCRRPAGHAEKNHRYS